MKKFFLSLVLAATVACMASPLVFAADSGFIAGGGSAGSGSGVGRDDIATSETASGIGRDDVLAFGGDMKDSVDKYGGGLGEGIDYAKEMWDKIFTLQNVSQGLSPKAAWQGRRWPWRPCSSNRHQCPWRSWESAPRRLP